MPKSKRGRDLEKWRSNRPDSPAGSVRVIGGKMRGQKLVYSGDKVTRPMKDNIREALFNLVGGYLKNKLVFDLFAGTGAVGIEALSREANFAYLIERHVPTTKIVRSNVQSVDVEDQVVIVESDTFFWGRQFVRSLDEKVFTESPDPFSLSEDLADLPWALFCSPPYDFFVEKQEQILTLIQSLKSRCPAGSLIVVESDERFEPSLLPEPDDWQVRQYAPALISVWKDE